MGPLSDRTVVLSIAVTLGVVFALVFWFARLNAPVESPFLWREAPAPGLPAPPPITQPKGTLL
ncbi:hypothetical protein KQ313_01070 [Synechococcus sp. CS-1325]|uniref:hypothetical protein n=1 Tax=unclassified Synechococcus TaxID=2626047 RepID=UPI000DB3F225|nr:MULTISPECIES: hypothetical protein [unclassified Synechococcus]MCT0198286.1 hypothetical protein [Synechococcus sp. CS-1325]MCT0230870.1 hypothetical protein [Synechococcus sp. CS-1324]PZV00714.1 MAG: hypothetical protein DCF24_06450 [Cyanobium sp.]PZV01148.1 MAG: hypothetical protein DCF23_13625 [Cyanobium sp.]